LWRRSLGGLQQRRLVAIEPEIGSLRLHLVRQSRNGLRAADFLPSDTKLARREAVAAFRAASLRFLGNLRRNPLVGSRRNFLAKLRTLLPFLHQPSELCDLLWPMHRGQFGPVQVLGDSPQAGFDVVEVHDTGRDALLANYAQRLEPVAPRNQ
jgi:hypothetical protein